MTELGCSSPACVRYSTCFFPDRCLKTERNKMNLSEIPVSNTPEYERVAIIDHSFECHVDWRKGPLNIPSGTALHIRKEKQIPALFKPKGG